MPKLPDDWEITLGQTPTVGMLRGWRKPQYWADMMGILPVSNLDIFKAAGHPVERPCTFSQFLEFYQDYVE